MTRPITGLAACCAALFALTSCTYVIESDTLELSDKLDALAARIEKIEKANSAAEIAVLKQNVQQIAAYLQNAAAQQRGPQARQPATMARRNAITATFMIVMRIGGLLFSYLKY